MFSKPLLELARLILEEARAKSFKIATAESCTGGLIAALLTEVPGSSDVVDRGFITYSDEAKRDMLGVPGDMIAEHGAVSEPVARAMAQGALLHSNAQISIAVTGIAGPTGDTPEKPVGLVHIASAYKGQSMFHEKLLLGDIGRGKVRLKTVKAGLELMRKHLN